MVAEAEKRDSPLRVPFLDTPDQKKKRRKRLCDAKVPHALVIQRDGVSKAQLYWTDLFHTLLNIPRGRFLFLFALIYLTQYTLFALFYLAQDDYCIDEVDHFSHALWFSVHTASTMGGINPNPDCVFTNLLVTIQIICCALLDYSLLGVVFLRFASPIQRASTIRFSKRMALYRRAGGAGPWCLTFRVANVRKHQVLSPRVRVMLLAFNDADAPEDSGGYRCTELAVECNGAPVDMLWLGLPTTVTHVVGPASPLAGVSLAEMEERDMELVVTLDGIDASTSGCIQARQSYHASDIGINEGFANVVKRLPTGIMRVNFADFDKMAPFHGAPQYLKTPSTAGASSASVESELATLSEHGPLNFGESPSSSRQPSPRAGGYRPRPPLQWQSSLDYGWDCELTPKMTGGPAGLLRSMALQPLGPPPEEEPSPAGPSQGSSATLQIASLSTAALLSHASLSAETRAAARQLRDLLAREA